MMGSFRYYNQQKIIFIYATWLRKLQWNKSDDFPNYCATEKKSGARYVEGDNYLVVPRRRRNPNHRYRSMDRIWFPNRCVPGYRNQSYQWQRSCCVSIHIRAPIGRGKTIFFSIFSGMLVRTLTHKMNDFDWMLLGVCVSFVCKSISEMQSKRLLQIERIWSGTFA